VLSLGDTAAEVFGGLALESGNFVFGAYGGGLDRGEEFSPTGAGVEFIDGTDRGVLILLVACVVGGVLYEVAVAAQTSQSLSSGKMESRSSWERSAGRWLVRR